MTVWRNKQHVITKRYRKSQDYSTKYKCPRRFQDMKPQRSPTCAIYARAERLPNVYFLNYFLSSTTRDPLRPNSLETNKNKISGAKEDEESMRRPLAGRQGFKEHLCNFLAPISETRWEPWPLSKIVLLGLDLTVPVLSDASTRRYTQHFVSMFLTEEESEPVGPNSRPAIYVFGRSRPVGV